MGEKAYIKKYRIQRGLLKGVGLKGRHRRLLKREFKKTLSPSMDILISSNLERLLWEIGGREKVCGWMAALQETGVFSLTGEEKALLDRNFLCGKADDRETREEIAAVWKDDGYVMDPHTAVASRVLRTLRARGV